MADGIDGSTGGSHNSHGPAYVNGNSHLAHRLKAQRKASSPMAPAFMVSAPGKVIVFGEHAVVHGKVSRSIRLISSTFIPLVSSLPAYCSHALVALN